MKSVYYLIGIAILFLVVFVSLQSFSTSEDTVEVVVDNSINKVCTDGSGFCYGTNGNFVRHCTENATLILYECTREQKCEEMKIKCDTMIPESVCVTPIGEAYCARLNPMI